MFQGTVDCVDNLVQVVERLKSSFMGRPPDADEQSAGQAKHKRYCFAAHAYAAVVRASTAPAD
ncbi:hypothetical protein NKI72_20510 [Mesorhizobium sp. M0437]|uniref:hypothetical protein n=1 Tax=Mesorhizobium sp. M0437 TaxID=2956945 RepID=UPI003335C140